MDDIDLVLLWDLLLERVLFAEILGELIEIFQVDFFVLLLALLEWQGWQFVALFLFFFRCFSGSSHLILHVIVVSVEAPDAAFTQHDHGDLLTSIRVGWHVAQQFVAAVLGGVYGEEHGRAILLAFE